MKLLPVVDIKSTFMAFGVKKPRILECLGCNNHLKRINQHVQRFSRYYKLPSNCFTCVLNSFPNSN